MLFNLEFKAADVANLIDIARNGEKHSLTAEMLFDKKYHKGGKLKLIDGWPDSKNIDHSKVEPHLQLVKDHGVYLLASSHRPKVDPVVYAKGLDPDKNDDWYDIAGSGLGGDDFSQAIDIEDIEEMLKGATTFIIGCRKNHFYFDVDKK